MAEPTPFQSPNPHALASILAAAETRTIIAATDIFDIAGIKLWAAKQPVSAELQRKLADRRLRQPLETSLEVENGIGSHELIRALRMLIDARAALSRLIVPHAARIERELVQLRIEPAVQLLLSVTESTRPDVYEHAVAAMALNAALASAAGADAQTLRAAALAGLCHDLGDMYIAPRFGEAQADRELDFVSYQQLVVHPHVGYLLLKQMTSYPAAVAQAVAEHHERLDGSGYPHARVGGDLSPQGRLLAVTEAALNALRDPDAPLLRASVALRAVPGEFDATWIGRISDAALAQPQTPSVMEPADIQARLEALDALLAGSQRKAAALAAQPAPAGMQEAVALAGYLLSRVRVGWNATGLWTGEKTTTANAAEVEAVEDELYRRLRGVQRVTLLRAGTLPPEDASRLAAFCDGLAMAEG